MFSSFLVPPYMSNVGLDTIWKYMEVRETKKTFLIFVISAYVNLGARYLYTIQTLE